MDFSSFPFSFSYYYFSGNSIIAYNVRIIILILEHVRKEILL